MLIIMLYTLIASSQNISNYVKVMCVFGDRLSIKYIRTNKSNFGPLPFPHVRAFTENDATKTSVARFWQEILLLYLYTYFRDASLKQKQ